MSKLFTFFSSLVLVPISWLKIVMEVKEIAEDRIMLVLVSFMPL